MLALSSGNTYVTCLELYLLALSSGNTYVTCLELYLLGLSSGSTYVFCLELYLLGLSSGNTFYKTDLRVFNWNIFNINHNGVIAIHWKILKSLKYKRKI